MRSESWHLAFFIFPSLVLLHLWISPFTKVEESFNIQATHDILANGVPTENVQLNFKLQYDHMTFPGAVPRTFLGALVLSGIAKPIKGYFNLSLPEQQFLARAILGLLNASAFTYYTYGIRRAFGKTAALWYTLLQASQFHLFYYASRTLPNMFAFGLSMVAMRFLLPDPTSPIPAVKRTRLALYLATITTIVFRAELVLLVASLCANLLLTSSFNGTSPIVILRTTIIPPLIAATVAGLALTVPIDTYFWRQSLSSADYIWPELSGFVSNIFPPPGSSGASDWGTSSFLWYFTSAIPRLLINPVTLTLLLASLTLPRLKPDGQSLKALVWPYMLYILLYSFLGHKETRFIFPIVPPLTTAVAVSAAYISDRRQRSIFNAVLTQVLLVSTLATAFLSHIVLAPLSALTYPGAHALTSLHTLSTIYPPQREIQVHLCNLALQTGVTRFLQYPPPISPLVILPGSPDGTRPELRSGSTKWVYDKSNNSTGEYQREGFWRQFDYAIVEWPEDAVKVNGRRWDVIDTIYTLGRPVVIDKHIGRGLLVLGHEEDPVLPELCKMDDGRCERRRGVRRYPDGLMRVLGATYGEGVLGRSIVWAYGIVHDVLREGWGVPGGVSLTGGRWVHWNMERTLYILKRGER